MSLSAVATVVDSRVRGFQPYGRAAFSWDSSGMCPSSTRMTRLLEGVAYERGSRWIHL